MMLKPSKLGTMDPVKSPQMTDCRNGYCRTGDAQKINDIIQK